MYETIFNKLHFVINSTAISDTYRDFEVALEAPLLLFKTHPSVTSRMFDLEERNVTGQNQLWDTFTESTSV